MNDFLLLFLMWIYNPNAKKEIPEYFRNSKNHNFSKNEYQICIPNGVIVGIDTSFVAVKFAIFEEKNQGSKKGQKNTIFQDLNNLHFVD